MQALSYPAPSCPPPNKTARPVLLCGLRLAQLKSCLPELHVESCRVDVSILKNGSYRWCRWRRGGETGSRDAVRQRLINRRDGIWNGRISQRRGVATPCLCWLSVLAGSKTSEAG